MGDNKKKGTRERILERSLELFSEKGYRAATMRDIAAAVGVRPGAIYNHFESKEEILQTLLNDLMESALINLFGGMEDPEIHRKGKSILAKIATTFKLISFDPRNEALFRLMMQELFRNERIRELYHEHFYQRNVKKLSALFFQMMQEEMIRSSDPLMLANEFFSPLFFYQMQVVLLKLDGKSTSSAVTLFEKHVDLFWESIRTRETERTSRDTLF
jgi:AcrR family transcriptional regulator